MLTTTSGAARALSVACVKREAATSEPTTLATREYLQLAVFSRIKACTAAPTVADAKRPNDGVLTPRAYCSHAKKCSTERRSSAAVIEATAVPARCRFTVEMRQRAKACS